MSNNKPLENIVYVARVLTLAIPAGADQLKNYQKWQDNHTKT